jgi:dienelactone hydrolase
MPVEALTSAWLGAAASAFDRALVGAMEWRRRSHPSPERSLSHGERLAVLARIEKAYGHPTLLSDPDAFFIPPSAITPKLVRVCRFRPYAEVLDCSWPSAYEPFLPEICNKYLGHARNRTAHARLFLAPEPRPLVVLVHGYLGGTWALEERAFPVKWLVRRGLDVAIVLLPFHALRAREDGRALPPFPGSDPRFTNEGFRQAVGDIRALIAWMRSRGASEVGLMGMSLGGYTTALLATVEAELSFAVPIVPLASIADFARDQGRLGKGTDGEAEHHALDAATRVVSPFARPSRIQRPDGVNRVLVVAGLGDRITPLAHAEGLSRHFGAPLVGFAGGHLLQFGRGGAFREVGHFLEGLGVMQ